MNNTRRKQLKLAIVHLNQASDIITEVCDDEEDSMSNIPESLQSGDLYTDMEVRVESMDDILDKIEDLISDVEDVME